MGEDKSTEVSIWAELTETGIKATIKSRALSAFDRFLGAAADKKRAPIDAEIAEANAMSNARVKMIEALGDLGVDKLKSDPNFAARAVDAFLPTLIRRQENKEAVLDLALEDLRHNPGTAEQAEEGPQTLDDGFLNRLERYIEDATDQQVRERWAKVLASEIRKPGTFSSKVLRVIDELDGETARLFEKVCDHLLAGALPKGLTGEISFEVTSRLVSAGLLVEPGLGQVQTFATTTNAASEEYWLTKFGNYGLAINKKDCVIKSKNGVIFSDGKILTIDVYVLTDVGSAIASILPDRRLINVNTLGEKLSPQISGSKLELYETTAEQGQLRLVRSFDVASAVETRSGQL